MEQNQFCKPIPCMDRIELSTTVVVRRKTRSVDNTWNNGTAQRH